MLSRNKDSGGRDPGAPLVIRPWLVFIGVVPHKGDFVPEPVGALWARVGRGAGEQGGEDIGVMCQEVMLEVRPGFLAVSAGGTLILHVGVLRGQ